MLRTRCIVLAGLLGGMMVGSLVAEADETSLAPPVLLPDGQQFKTWQVPLQFTRTYYVAQGHPQASDANPGTQDRPFRTISRAAEVLQPGERVLVAAGTYRERVRPARGGTSAERMISYEAKPGATVILSGSRPLAEKWTPSVRAGRASSGKLWMARLPAALFLKGNPFAQVNLADEQIDRWMDWAIATKGKPPNTLRRGLVFVNGRRLRQTPNFEKLAEEKGAYWVEPDGLTLHVHPEHDGDPDAAKIEVTTEGMIFAPAVFGLGYIRLKGFTIEHAGNCFPVPQQGAVSAMRGHHWIIEDNTVLQCNSIGIDIGRQDDSPPNVAQGGRHIVRRNRIFDCGVGGIEGIGVEHTLIEDNFISNTGWQHAGGICETGGIKVHLTFGTVIRRNHIEDSINAAGIWMDWLNRNSRCMQNVVIRSDPPQGGIFMEASQVANMVDHNIVWDSKSNGIYQHDCDELVIAHNLVGQCRGAAVRMHICWKREVGGRMSTARRCKILNNIFLQNGQMMAISDHDNFSDGNLFGAGCPGFDLAKWRKEYGWDAHSSVVDLRAALQDGVLDLSWPAGGWRWQSPRVARIAFDYFQRPYAGDTACPGPFGIPEERTSALSIRLW